MVGSLFLCRAIRRGIIIKHARTAKPAFTPYTHCIAGAITSRPESSVKPAVEATIPEAAAPNEIPMFRIVWTEVPAI